MIGPTRVRCRHRSERPFISSLGRWTLHLISNKGNFSILQPVHGDAATELGFYYFSLRRQRFPAAISKNPPRLSLDSALHLFLPPCELAPRPPILPLRVQRGRQLWVSTKRLVGSLFASFFGGNRLSFFVGARSHGSAIVQGRCEG